MYPFHVPAPVFRNIKGVRLKLELHAFVQNLCY